jgi:hypothetical protein
MINVYVYDTNCQTLRHPFDILALDPSQVVLASATAAARGANWGVQLQWPPPGTSDVYELVVDDPTFAYAPRIVGDFNAAPGGKLDVVIESLPQSGIGGGGGGGGGMVPTSTFVSPPPLEQVIEKIEEAPKWTPEERRGVRMLLNAFLSLHAASESSLQQRVGRWRNELHRLGLDVRAIGEVQVKANFIARTQ